MSTTVGKAGAVSESDEQSNVTARPYKSSWVDRFTDWVDRLPGPYWLFYLVVAATYSTASIIIPWLFGSPLADSFTVEHALDGFTLIYFIAVIHYLDQKASAALASFRPVMKSSKENYGDLHYRLTTMPARTVLIATIIGLVYGQVFNVLISTPDPGQPQIVLPLAASIMNAASGSISWMTNVIFAVHAFRQLRLISRIYTEHTNVNIFETGPLYALSRITFITTIAVLIITFVYLTFYAGFDLQNPLLVVDAVVFNFVALVTFIWPLWGAHKILQQEKERRKGMVTQRIEMVTDQLHAMVDARNLAGGDVHKSVLDALVVEQGIITKLSTWPWDPEALRVVISALLLPVIIWLITHVLERLGI